MLCLVSGGPFYLPPLHWTDDRSCELWGFRSGVIEDFGLVGCDAASLGKWFPMFRKNASHSSRPFNPWGWRRHVLSKCREPLTQRLIPHPRRLETVTFVHKNRAIPPLISHNGLRDVAFMKQLDTWTYNNYLHESCNKQPNFILYIHLRQASVSVSHSDLRKYICWSSFSSHVQYLYN